LGLPKPDEAVQQEYDELSLEVV